MAKIDDELAAIGEERQEARAKVLEASAQIAQLAQEALEAGLTKSEIARLAKVSRPALDFMLKQHALPTGRKSGGR